jgi:hypothetical protein
MLDIIFFHYLLVGLIKKTIQISTKALSIEGAFFIFNKVLLEF